MSTLAHFKRRLRVGTRLQCVVNTLHPALNGRIREVSKVQTNGFFWTHLSLPDQRRSWSPLPPVKHFRWLDTDTVQIDLHSGVNPDAPTVHYVQLRFVQGEQL